MKKYFKMDVHDIVEISMLVAIAIILDRFVKIPVGASGGSINFSCIPLLILALRHGPFKSFIGCGIIFGFITCLFDGWGMQWFALDYLIAFGAISIVGLLGRFVNENYNKDSKKKIICHILVSCLVMCFILIRILASTIDGMIFAEYSFIASFIYNLSYVLLSGIIGLVAINLLLPLISRINKRFQTSYLK